MASIILPHRWRTQPPAGAKVDWAHPLARGLQVAVSADVAHFASGNKTQLSAGRKASTYGFSAPYREPTGNFPTNFGTFPGDTGQNYSIEIFVRWAAAHDGQGHDVVYFGANQAYGMRGLAATGAGASIYSITYNGDQSAGTWDTSGNWQHVVVSCSRSATNFYKNGALVGTTGVMGITATAVNNVMLHRGWVWLSAPVEIAKAAYYTSALSFAEVRALYENPWQIFQPLQRRIWVGGAVSGLALPTLSAIAPASITQTTCIPRVSATWA